MEGGKENTLVREEIKGSRENLARAAQLLMLKAKAQISPKHQTNPQTTRLIKKIKRKKLKNHHLLPVGIKERDPRMFQRSQGETLLVPLHQSPEERQERGLDREIKIEKPKKRLLINTVENEIDPLVPLRRPLTNLIS